MLNQFVWLAEFPLCMCFFLSEEKIFSCAKVSRYQNTVLHNKQLVYISILLICSNSFWVFNV